MKQKLSADNRISVRLSEKLERQLQQEALATGKQESAVVRTALEQYFQQRGQISCYDLAMEAGLVGVLRDEPADLSTHQKHLKGFGKS